MSDLTRWLERISALSRQEIELGLERVEHVYAQLGSPLPAAQTVTIGGTNGKGSCAAFVERCLRKQGLRVGVYSSPHLLRFNERIKAGGRDIDDASLCAAFERVEAARDGQPLTFFEYTTLAAVVWFSEQDLDVAVLEVGLGGRLDAVNVVAADVAVVTTIALDHQDYLGDTREQIGLEKAGIFRRGRPAVCADPLPPDGVREHALQVAALARFRGAEFHCECSEHGWTARSENYVFNDLPLPPATPLAAFAGGIEALSQLGRLPEEALLHALLRGWQLAGRTQRVAGAPAVVLDVAHNPHAGAALARALAREPVSGTTTAVVGMLADKDVEAFCTQIVSVVDDFIAVDIDGIRAQSAVQLATRLRRVSAKPIRCSASLAGAMARAHARLGAGDRLLVCGSFHIVGPALAWLGIYSDTDCESE